MLTTDEDRVRETLDRAQCRRLLTTAMIGRLAFTEGALPAVLPVAFTLHSEHVLIALPHDDPVVNAVRRAVVALEVDDYDPAARTGWSVTVVGPSRKLAGTLTAWARGRLPALTGHPDPAGCYLAVRLDLVRGWRMLPSPVDARRPVVGPAAVGGTNDAPIA
jgi:hypothetical protein